MTLENITTQELFVPSEMELMTLNMGPQHPSTHGVLRLILELDGETVVKCTPDIGYLHRGMEKIAENKMYQCFIPYTDKMDYLSPMNMNLGYVLACEALWEPDELAIPERAIYIRMLMAELGRILAHLISVGCMAMDIGAMTIFLYTFNQRELIYDLYEMASGARMNVTYIRIGGVWEDLPEGWVEKCREFIKGIHPVLDDVEGLLYKNPIWNVRTKDLGKISSEEGLNLGLSGPSLRASGIDWDLRKSNPYLYYDQVHFDVITGENGDCYDRFVCRVKEMRESCKIIDQLLDHLPEGPVHTSNRKVWPPPKKEGKKSMEALIHHFLLFSEGLHAPEGEAYVATEAPKGVLGFYINSKGDTSPWRCRVRSPSFNNLSGLERLVKGHLIADVVTILGSLDIVLGEIDR